MKRYFLSTAIADEKFEKEVSLEEFCKAERAAGFRPKMSRDDPEYMTTPATGGFSSGYVSGYITMDTTCPTCQHDPCDCDEQYQSYKERGE